MKKLELNLKARSLFKCDIGLLDDYIVFTEKGADLTVNFKEMIEHPVIRLEKKRYLFNFRLYFRRCQA